MTFQLWSEINKDALSELKPDFGFRSWAELSEDDKYIIWKHLESFFFDRTAKSEYNNTHLAKNEGTSNYYKFHGDREDEEIKCNRIINTVYALNNLYKAKSYAKKYLKNSTAYNACTDFYLIYSTQSENVVIELLSLYSKETILERGDDDLFKENGESKKEFKKRQETWRWGAFDSFSEKINEVFSHFGLNIYLTRQGFIPKQEEKIIAIIYEPILKVLSHQHWHEVNKLLSDAFSEYRKNTPAGFSSCITHTVASVQAFLQVLLNGEIGKGEISKLIAQAQTKSLIPSDPFSKVIFNNVVSTLMQERQEKGDAHPKAEYATEKNARLVLNLAMVFFQHCIIN